jgi:hypothetical protein
MNVYKGGEQPWGLPEWMLPILNDFWGKPLHQPFTMLTLARPRCRDFFPAPCATKRCFNALCTEHRSGPGAADPVYVSWLPRGAVLRTLCELPEEDRLALIREQAHLSSHFNWGVDPFLFNGAVHHTRRYFSSVVTIHDPRNGLPAAAWWPGGECGAGEVARHRAYTAIFKRATRAYAR